MATTAWKGVGSFATIYDATGAMGWSNTGSASPPQDGTFALAYATSANDTSDGNVGDAWGFTTSDIPSGSTIDGIEFRIAYAYDNGSASYMDVQLYDGTNLIGNAKQITSFSYAAEAAGNTLGGASDLWGATISDTLVRSSGFGIVAWATVDTADADLGFDYMEMRVHYTEPSGTIESGAGSASGSATVSGAGSQTGTITRTTAVNAGFGMTATPSITSGGTVTVEQRFLMSASPIVERGGTVTVEQSFQMSAFAEIGLARTVSISAELTVNVERQIPQQTASVSSTLSVTATPTHFAAGDPVLMPDSGAIYVHSLPDLDPPLAVSGVSGGIYVDVVDQIERTVVISGALTVDVTPRLYQDFVQGVYTVVGDPEAPLHQTTGSPNVIEYSATGDPSPTKSVTGDPSEVKTPTGDPSSTYSVTGAP